MSAHIIELNDRNVILRNENDALVQSPGFANIVDKQPVFGEEARRVARLHPRQTFNQFWSQLSLDPLINSNTHFRHQADLAFAHLNDIASRHELREEVIFAVPSNYNRNQLSILLGLVQSCEHLDAAGLVDMPLLLAGNSKDADMTVYLDIQLHQSVLTTFADKDGAVTRDKVVQIPGAGLIAIHDAWTNMVTDEFIKQSRFDPHHNAETEQYVYNQLDSWSKSALKDNEILMEINNKGSVYQARINRGHFEQRVRNILGRIKAELETLAAGDYRLCLPHSLAELPGLSLYLNNIDPVPDSLILENCQSYLDYIKGEPGSMSFITTLPLNNKSKTSASAKTRTASSGRARDDRPSHILVNDRAYALPASLHFGPLNGEAASGILVETSGGSGEITITLTDSGALLEYKGEGSISLNNSKAATGNPLKLGDIIKLPGSESTLRLIQVE